MMSQIHCKQSIRIEKSGWFKHYFPGNCMLMDLLHGFEVLSTTEETLFNSRNVSRLVQNNLIPT